MTRIADLPRWVWDVLADLVRYEDIHAKDERCLDTTLERIPLDVRRTAAVIASYRVVDAEVQEEPEK